MANLPWDLGRSVPLSQSAALCIDATTESLTCVNTRSAAESFAAAPFAQVATSALKKPTDPPAIRDARSVNSLGGFTTFSRISFSTAGTPRKRAVTDLSRSAGGGKNFFIIRTKALHRGATYGV